MKTRGGKTIWILGDQLSRAHSGLAEGDPRRDRVLMIESRARGSHLRYHKIKLAMIYSAMRHFAAELREEGWQVDYHRMIPDFETGLRAQIEQSSPHEVVVMEPNSWQEREVVQKLARKLKFQLALTPPVQFLRSREDFIEWARPRGRLLMETHYREMRKRLGLLMQTDGTPEGGAWNLDAENRLTIRDYEKAGRPQPRASARPVHDKLTKAAIADVEKYFPQAPGSAEDLWVPVTRAEALAALDDFVKNRLGLFGDYEDLMVSDNGELFHSLLSAPINIGLLDPLECVRAAESAYRSGHAPLNAVEGFIRQIIGWREFINGIYWLKMPEYAQVNALGAVRKLPEFFWSGETEMRCLSLVLRQTEKTAFNHHIQRLMILGNFLLLAGVNPQQALQWFNEMYVDAFDWVMAANLLGMSLHADGGYMATKPYAGSASYISKMSDYCSGCRYRPDQKIGPDACPYNLLYWDFYDRHSERFAKNPRTAVMVKAWTKRSEREKEVIRREAAAFLDRVAPQD